ncbi:MAG: energy-coupling factor transporter transmembrane component T [Bacillota bacterium]|nr:energy-coupling factor transporter transmembrane component T [Bacillota bacterium]
MKVSLVDILSIKGDSFLHKSHTGVKIFATILLIAAIIISKNSWALGALALTAVSLLAYVKLNVIKQLPFYLYPLFFSLLYGRLIMGFSGELLFLIVAKATTAVMVLLLLIVTTPYYKIFNALSMFLPSVLVDIMLLTYRSIFLLISKIVETFTAIKIKGGTAFIKPQRWLASIGSFLSLSVIKAIDLNERNYWIMQMRGYEGKMATRNSEVFKLSDINPVIFAIIFFVMAVLG